MGLRELKDKLKASVKDLNLEDLGRTLGTGAAKVALAADQIAQAAKPHVETAVKAGSRLVKEAESAFDAHLASRTNTSPSERAASKSTGTPDDAAPSVEPTEPAAAAAEKKSPTSKSVAKRAPAKKAPLSEAPKVGAKVAAKRAATKSAPATPAAKAPAKKVVAKKPSAS